MPKMLRHRNRSGVDLPRNRHLCWAGLSGRSGGQCFVLWHRWQHRRLDRQDRFALLFEHVPARIDARHALVVMVQERLNKIDRQTRGLSECRARAPEIMGREASNPFGNHDAANGFGLETFARSVGLCVPKT